MSVVTNLGKKVPRLTDFAHWADLNSDKNFSIFDYIYGVFTEKSLAPDIFVAFLRLYWPEFLEKGSYVFLKDSYSDEKYNSLVVDNTKSERIEFWINLLEIDAFFSESKDFKDDPEFFEFCKYLGFKLKEIWSVKLSQEYPHKTFEVECILDNEKFEVFVVFYQLAES